MSQRTEYDCDNCKSKIIDPQVDLYNYNLFKLGCGSKDKFDDLCGTCASTVRIALERAASRL